MTGQVTTYRTQGKVNGLTFLFKYDLNGNLKAFEVAEGVLNDYQMSWLYSGRFPATEELIKVNWVNNEKVKAIFEIIISPADLSFEALWELYDYKFGKQDAIKMFKKLKEADVIKVFVAVPKYNDYLARTPGIGKLHLATFINKRRFEDELPSVPPVYKKPTQGKNFNPIIGDLAARKTDK